MREWLGVMAAVTTGCIVWTVLGLICPTRPWIAAATATGIVLVSYILAVVLTNRNVGKH
jgi:hypothetical protein